MTNVLMAAPPPRKFADPLVTAKGEKRAWVALAALETLWFNTGTLCNVSLDHYGACVHEEERGARSWRPTIARLLWLAQNGFCLHVASRRLSGESEEEIRRGFARLFAGLGIAIDAADPVALTVFPEMDAAAEVPEITEACWGILGKSPASVMCASSRMIVKRKGAAHPVIVACTLLPYDPRFELGHTLAEARDAVPLNHPHCAKFCVPGGGACGCGSRPLS